MGNSQVVFFFYRSLIHPHTHTHHDKPFSLSLSKFAFGTSEEFSQKRQQHCIFL
jgi:hypothetical protein